MTPLITVSWELFIEDIIGVLLYTPLTVSLWVIVVLATKETSNSAGSGYSDSYWKYSSLHTFILIGHIY